MRKYRSNVAALIMNPKGKVLVCERSGQDGAWQFPQGGVDTGESKLETLFREVWEEVGLPPDSYEAIEYREGYRYEFPLDKRKSKGYCGQEQTYFLCQIKANAPEPNIHFDSNEFQNYKWISPKKFKSKWLPKWKRDVYRSVLWDFFGARMVGG